MYTVLGRASIVTNVAKNDLRTEAIDGSYTFRFHSRSSRKLFELFFIRATCTNVLNFFWRGAHYSSIKWIEHVRVTLYLHSCAIVPPLSRPWNWPTGMWQVLPYDCAMWHSCHVLCLSCCVSLTIVSGLLHNRVAFVHMSYFAQQLCLVTFKFNSSLFLAHPSLHSWQVKPKITILCIVLNSFV